MTPDTFIIPVNVIIARAAGFVPPSAAPRASSQRRHHDKIPAGQSAGMPACPVGPALMA